MFDPDQFDHIIRSLEDFPEPDNPAAASAPLEFQQIAPGAVFSPRRGGGPHVTVRRVNGALVYFYDERRADFCGLPHFLAQYSLFQPAAAEV